ncbi:MAG: DNA topoisomerase 3 [Defluviitaleaceae bacterium]|nr:DNA topoisomerase 3 [Defluviitaleaceae bacterium]
MRLVIAEKPSVGKSLADVLGAKSKKDGFYEGNGYIVSWCIGHLLGLADPKDYDEKYEKWRKEDLPILPETWKYNSAAKTRAQLKILKDLLKRADVEAVVNACDSGREGELIFRLVYDHCKCKKPIQRLWISSMEESAIREGFNNLRNGAEYDNLHHAALCRQQADWAVGMNYSRLFGCLYNILGCSIGRVQTPTLVMICDREARINGFVKEPFYTVEVAGLDFTATSERIKNKADADSIVAKINGKTAVVQSVEKHEKSTAPPKLYDLTTLQREANRMFGYSAKQTLEYAQNLYEKKILTYPRTDSRFLTEDMQGGLTALADSICGYMPFPVEADFSFSQVINNSKVTDHHAIIPTTEAAKINLDSASGEKNILLMVAARFLAAVSPKQKYAETVITVSCEGEIFTAKGKTIISEGWKAVDDAFISACGNKKSGNKEETALPNLTQGQQFTAAAGLKEGFTSAPRPFTEDTLLLSMENATADDMQDAWASSFAKQNDQPQADFQQELAGIGTPATRAEVIEKLLRQEYIIRKDKQLRPTEKGINLVKILPDNDSVKSPLLTAEWENNLKRVERGEISAHEFMNAVADYVRNTVSNNQTVPESKKHLITPRKGAGTGEPLGKCPRCGNDILENKVAFSCANRDCKFALWKDSKFFTAKKKKLTKEIAIALINDGRIFLSGLYSSKSSKTYNATIILDSEGTGFPSFTMEYEKK